MEILTTAEAGVDRVGALPGAAFDDGRRISPRPEHSSKWIDNQDDGAATDVGGHVGGHGGGQSGHGPSGGSGDPEMDDHDTGPPDLPDPDGGN